MDLLRRILNDYFMPDRWILYRAFLAAAKAKGYTFVRHQDAESVFSAGGSNLFFLRHDVDTDLACTRIMFSIERELGIRSTYYFRRCTADIAFMREIHSTGSEVGYHYEELSEHIKVFGTRKREGVLPHMETIRETFLRNLMAFENDLGAKVYTIASHGDWANRRVGINNTELINEKIRAEAGIQLEAYDESLLERVSFRVADMMFPGLWNPASPIEAIEALSPVILVLIHPRHWQRAPLIRLRLDAQRLLEGIRYSLK